ncbi:MAG: hypothetical protein WA718_20460, partial [Terriglobales bacterium]
MRRSLRLLSLIFVISASVAAHTQTALPKLTLDEFFNSVSFTALSVSPDGNSTVIGTERPDWDQQIFRKELWLYRTAPAGPAPGSLIQLTQSGHDSAPHWSPDGRWIAFLSERKSSDTNDAGDSEAGGDSDKGRDKNKDKDTAQLFLVSPSGGEAFPVTSGEDEVHAFAWS